MDIHMWASIANVLLAFTVGGLMAMDTDLPIWALSLVYFVVVTLVYIAGFYVFGVTL